MAGFLKDGWRDLTALTQRLAQGLADPATGLGVDRDCGLDTAGRRH